MVGLYQVTRSISDVWFEREDADPASLLLYGECFEVETLDNEWVFGRCQHDGFIGYVRRAELSERIFEPTHTITALQAPVLRGPFLRYKPREFLSLGTRVHVIGARDQFLLLSDGGWIYKAHVVEGAFPIRSHVDIAEKMVGTPFVWGGRSAFGFDCTGFIQFVFGLVGVRAARNISEQAETLGFVVDTPMRGDLFFLERRGNFFHAGIFVSEINVISAGYKFAGIGIQEFREIVSLYHLVEGANGTLEQFRVRLRRVH